MVRITFLSIDGTRHDVHGEEGASLMECARRAGIPGIIAECGGACVCATCHVFVDEAWREQVGPPGDTEDEMLDFAAGREQNSRLSCQVRLRPSLDGLIVRIPGTQG